jgi:hypothetical protein
MVALSILLAKCAGALLFAKYSSEVVVKLIDLKDPRKTQKENIVEEGTKQIDPRATKLLSGKKSVAG